MIFVFGASCSGKSTLSMALRDELKWDYIDRDEIEPDDAKVAATLEKVIKKISGHAIIDVQIPWREKKEGEWYVLVQPPLDTLLERDKERERNSQGQRSKWATHYVKQTHKTLEESEMKFDLILDSSQLSKAEEVGRVRKLCLLNK